MLQVDIIKVLIIVALVALLAVAVTQFGALAATILGSGQEYIGTAMDQVPQGSVSATTGAGFLGGISLALVGGDGAMPGGFLGVMGAVGGGVVLLVLAVWAFVWLRRFL